MNNEIIEARELIVKAREALRRGDKAAAWQLGERAALLAPDMEDAWLILAASEPDPQEALAYAQKALQLSPQSTRAHRAVEWTRGRLKQIEALKELAPVSQPVMPHRVNALTGLPEKPARETAVMVPPARSTGRKWLLPALLAGGICVLFGLFALFALTSPVFASIVSSVAAPAPTQEDLWAPVDISKPEVTPVDDSAVVVQAADTATSVPTEVPPTTAPTEAPAATPTPTEAPTQEPTFEPPTAAATETPGAITLEIVQDTPTSEYVAPKPDPEIVVGNGERWIDVDLTNQRVYAYEGDVVVNSFIVSTGTWLTPTVTGKYKVYVKYRSASMSGPGYYLPDVPYIMYFYKGYGLHGTYWHNNFGTPMSHGCVNLRTDEAGWLFNWASVGTVVNVHY